jgi:hypothetical protein
MTAPNEDTSEAAAQRVGSVGDADADEESLARDPVTDEPAGQPDGESSEPPD